MKLQVTHETRYDYVPAVETAQHMAYLRPLTSHCQTLLSHTLTISPAPEKVSQMVDVFGNTRSFFSLQTPHRQLRVVAHSVLVTNPQPVPESRITWEQTRELFRYQSGARLEPATEFVFPSPFCPRHADFYAYAQPSFAPGVGVLAAAQDLMRRIHTDFNQYPGPASIGTAKRGVPGFCPHHDCLPACHGHTGALCQWVFADPTATGDGQTPGQ